jgi:hypothetical protein
MPRILKIGLLLLIMMPSCANGANCASIRIVENGNPKANIVIAPDASAQVRSAARTLQLYIRKSTKAKIAIVPSNSNPTDDGQIRIWVGPSTPSRILQPILQKMDGDGFIISFPSKKDIFVIGPTDWGTEFGIYEFLEKYIGIRWLMPGPDGEYVPVNNTIDIPAQEIKEEPAFFSRELSGFGGPEQRQWARRNRMHGRVKFHHNLKNIFPPEKYTNTHPEFFPIHKNSSGIKKQRYLPKGNKDYMWQP